MSARPGLGDKHPAAHIRANTPRELLPLPANSLSRSPLELREIGEASLDQREVSASFLFIGFLAFLGFSVVVSYVALVSFVDEPVQYQVGRETDALKSHYRTHR